MADMEHEELPETQTIQAGSPHTLYHELMCQPGPPTSFEGCSGDEAGMDGSPIRLRRCLGGRFGIMCPALGPDQVPCPVDTARELLMLEWPEARAAAQRGKTGASPARSTSSSGPGVTLTKKVVILAKHFTGLEDSSSRPGTVLTLNLEQVTVVLWASGTNSSTVTTSQDHF